MSQYDELKATDEYQQSILDELTNPYNYIDDNMPEWAREAVQAAKDKGIVQGDGDGLALTYSELRILTWMYRAGVFN